MCIKDVATYFLIFRGGEGEANGFKGVEALNN